MYRSAGWFLPPQVVYATVSIEEEVGMTIQSIHQVLEQEAKTLSDDLVAEVLDFIQFLKSTVQLYKIIELSIEKINSKLLYY